MYRLFAAILLTLPLSACAYVTAKPITPGEPYSGIPINQVKPLWMVKDGVGSVITVPSTHDRFALQIGSILAKNETQFVLSANGTLQSLKTQQDSTDALATLEELAKSVEGLRAGGASLDQQSSGRLELYEFVFAADGTVSLRRIYPLAG